MATSIPLEYPAGLPCPSSAGMAWTEHRELSADDLPGPRAARPLFTDRLGTQTLLFFFRTRPALQEWIDWFEIVRGNWFAAYWPQPQGGVGVRRFRGAPRYSGFMPRRGGWAVSIECQIRGRGELPVAVVSNCSEAIDAAELAQTEIALVHEYWASDPPVPPVTVGVYVVKIRTPGSVEPGSLFPCDFTIAWDDLDDPSVVDLFSCTRTATGSSTVTANFTITDAPSETTPMCKAIMFQTTGAWTSGGTVENGFVTVNGEVLGFSSYSPDLVAGPGYLTAEIVLRNNHGVITATRV